MTVTGRVGDLAYLETVRDGLVKCKVMYVKREDNGDLTLVVRVTASRGCYKLGEAIKATALHIIPRGAIYKRRGEYFPRIRPYKWDAP